MAKYQLQIRQDETTTVNLDICAKYDGEGNDISETYVKKGESGESGGSGLYMHFMKFLNGTGTYYAEMTIYDTRSTPYTFEEFLAKYKTQKFNAAGFCYHANSYYSFSHISVSDTTVVFRIRQSNQIDKYAVVGSVLESDVVTAV